jgi:hypothetical protein
MAVFKTVESTLPAGSTIKPGDNPGIDDAIAKGDASVAGVTVNADGNYAYDGVELKVTGAPSRVVDESKLTEYADEIAAAADLQYLAQNTGVNTSDMSAAYESLGIDPNDTMASSDLNKVLKAAGYNPGEQVNFYGSNTPNDVGAQILFDRWQNVPTEQDLIDAGLDPSEISISSSNSANAFYLEQKMKEMGYSAANTKGRFGSTAGFLGGNLSSFGDRGASTAQEARDEMDRLGGTDNSKILDMLEWDLLKKKKTTGNTGNTGTGGLSGNVSGVGGNVGGGQTTGGNTGSYGGPAYVSTPTTGIATPVYSTGQTGLTEVKLPTYEQGLKNQETEFTNRAAAQQGFYQPQTLGEQQAAGTAPAFESVLYRNRFGMTQYIQHINGVPSQPIPPGYFRVTGFGTEDQGAAATAANQGGMIQGFNDGAIVNPAINFQPGGAVVEQDGIYKIKYPDGTYSQGYDTANNAANALNMGTSKLGLPDYNTYLTNQGIDRNLPGYDEAQYRNMYQSYVQDPATLQNIQDQAAAKEKEDAIPASADLNKDQATGQIEVSKEGVAQAQRDLVAQATVAPGGAVAAAPVSYIDPNATGTVVESTAGQAIGTAPIVRENEVAQIDTATSADVPQKIGASQISANQAYGDVKSATDDMTAVTSTGPTESITGQEQKTSSVSGLDAASGDSIDVDAPDPRKLEDGESVAKGNQGLSSVDQSKVDAAFGTGEVGAASVQDELAGLMSQFEGGETPAWAAGSMRKASQMLAERGLGASSMAGQAVIQAAMEAALPIAQIDTANKQQMALFKAEQRAKFLQMDFDQDFQAKVINAAKVSDIANMNFTAEQQIALENSRAANTMELQNLNNEQALVMAEAAALSQLDTQNLNNRQQAEVQNAQNFLQIDMANLANEQQTALFKQQSLVSSILSDQAAANAAQQFNATSENQTNQFFANLSASVNQFNAAQINAMKQFNADEVNSLLEFNAGIQNQREMFNAQNYLVVAQANAQWRQNLATINTAAANESNMEYAQTVNALTIKTLDEIWQRERDIMDYSFTQSENSADRALSILLGDKKLEAIREQLDSEEQQALGSLMTKIFFSSDTKALFS